MLKFKWETEFKQTEIGEIPLGWEVKPIGEVFNLVKGKRCQLESEPIQGYIPYLLIDNYKTGNITYWTNEKQPFCNELDIVIVADGESSGKLLRFQSGILGSTLLALKPKMKIKDIENYIYLMLRSIEDNLIEHRTGSAIPHLDKDYLLNLKVAIPPQPVLEKFHSLVEPLFQKSLPIRSKSWC